MDDFFTRIILLHENNMLRAENRALSQALALQLRCTCCNEPIMQDEGRELRLENAILRSELHTLNCFKERLNSYRARLPATADTSSWHYAAAVMTSFALKEVVSLAREGNPLWITREMLSVEGYYTKYFPWFARNAPGFVHEASKATTLIHCDVSQLVQDLMTHANLPNMFPTIIGDVYMESQHRSFQLVNVDYMPQISLIKSRNVKLLRCSMNIDNFTWVIGEFSMYFTSYEQPLRPEFMRFPSGYLIKKTSDGVSKVTVIDHWVYKDDQLINYHNLGFGAYRSILALQRYCYDSWFITIPTIGHHIEFFDPNIRTNLLNLSKFMVYKFCTGVCGITKQNWIRFQTIGLALNNIKMFAQETLDMNGVACVLFSGTGSVQLQVRPETIFGLIKNARKQDIWNYLIPVGDLKEIICIQRTQIEGNEICVFSFETGLKGWYLIQETYMDGSGSMIIHACIEAPYVEAVLNNGDLSNIEILPCGFAIMPRGLDGSVVSAGCQIKTITHRTSNGERLMNYMHEMVNGTIGNVQSTLLANH